MKREARAIGRILIQPSNAPKVDKLAERINTLACPRDYLKEKMPEGLFDTLPPEGKYMVDMNNPCNLSN